MKRHTARRAPDRAGITNALDFVWCPTHSKRAWLTRKAADSAIRRIREPMREYPCDRVDGGWHIGHLPPDVRKGVITAPEIYSKRGTA